jgi:hypothetical protein
LFSYFILFIIIIIIIVNSYIKTGTKASFIKKIKELDVYFTTTFHRKLSPANEQFVNRTINMNSVDDDIVSKVNDCKVTLSMIRQLDTAKLIQNDCIDAMLELFRKRDNKIRRVTILNRIKNHFSVQQIQ